MGRRRLSLDAADAGHDRGEPTRQTSWAVSCTTARSRRTKRIPPRLTLLLSPAYYGHYVIVDTNGSSTARRPPAAPGKGPTATTTPLRADVVTTDAGGPPGHLGRHPSAGVFGRATTVSWTVTNFGDPVWSGTQYWDDEVWSRPTRPSSRPARPSRRCSPTPMRRRWARSQSYTMTQSVTVPAGIGGKTNPRPTTSTSRPTRSSA